MTVHACPPCPSLRVVLVEARPFFTEPPVMYPSVFIANALAAFALNLVRDRAAVGATSC